MTDRLTSIVDLLTSKIATLVGFITAIGTTVSSQIEIQNNFMQHVWTVTRWGFLDTQGILAIVGGSTAVLIGSLTFYRFVEEKLKKK